MVKGLLFKFVQRRKTTSAAESGRRDVMWPFTIDKHVHGLSF